MDQDCRKVLVTDDDPGITEVVQVLLERQGYQVAVAKTGNEALERYRSFAPCVLILDLDLPDINGDGVLDLLKIDPTFAKVRTIILTASDDLGHKKDLLCSSADDYVTKPFSPDELLARVQAQMRSHRQLESARREKEKFSHLSLRDPLTGLYNRRYLDEEALPNLLSVSCREDTPLCCALLDIDSYDDLCDAHTHAAGDLILRKVAEIIKDSVRESDVVARFGGDEFVVLMHNTGTEGGLHCCEVIRDRVANTVVPYQGRELKTTISCGIAGRKVHGIFSGTKLLRTADKALSAAKTEGKNCARIFTKSSG